MHLPVARFKLTIRAVTPIILPPYKGSTFRGGFGHAFRKVTCALRNTTCDECLARGHCVYLYVFETPPSLDATMLPKDGSAPHPFVIEPPIEDRTHYQTGDILIFNLVLIGRALNYLPFFIYAFDELGRRGIGRSHGQFELICAHSHNGEGGQIEVYNAEEKILRNTFSPVGITAFEPPQNCGRMNIHLISPFRMQENGRLQSRVTFDSFIKNLLRRIHFLNQIHGDGGENGFEHKRLIEESKSVRTVLHEVKWMDFERYSNRQRTRMKLGGVIGNLTFEGELGPYYNFLKFGEFIHVGKGATFGLGKYEITTNNEPT